MNLKRTFTTIHILLIVLLIVLSGLSLLMFQNKANVKKYNKIKMESYAIATKLRKTSNNLTRNCRTYVLTGDSNWEKNYWHSLDVRNGIKPWSNGKTISYQDSLKYFDLTPLEISKLTLAEENSNKLVLIEETAMNAMKGLFDDGTGNFIIKGEPNPLLARSILYDDNYLKGKSKVLIPIEEFFEVFNQRMDNQFKKYDTLSYWLLGTINLLIFLIITVSTVSYFTIKNKIILQLDELKKAKTTAEEIAKENKKLSVAVEQSANTVVITDTKGNIEYINPKFTERTGYTAEEVLGKSQRLLKSGTQSQEYYGDMWKTIKSGNIWKGNFHNKAKDGTYFWEHLTITPIKDASGKIVNYLGIKEDITALKESEQRLHTLINASPDVILFKDGEGKWIEANKATLELFELTTIDYKGKTDADLAKEVVFYKEALAGCNITDEIAWKHKDISYVEEIVPTPNGGDKILDTIKIPLFNKDNSRKGLVIMARDITERRKSQLILKESENNLENAQEIAKIGSFNLDLKTDIGTTSKSFSTITEFKLQSELSFLEWRTIVHADDTSANQKELEKCIKTGEKFDLEYRIITKDTQELKWIHGLGEVVYEDGKPTNFRGTIQDITERKKSQLILTESKNNLTNAQKIAKIGSFNLDLKANSAKTSASFDTISGFSNDDVKTLEVWRKTMHPEDAQENKHQLEEIIKSGKKYDREYRILTHNTKELKWIHSVGEVIYNNGEPTNFRGTIQDITERKKAEQELLKEKEKVEESDRLKTEFLNNMSHEIRTPMNGILGFSGLLAEPEITDKKRKYFVSIIQNSGNQLLQIIDDLLEISRLGTKQVKVIESEVCLNDLLLEQFSIFDVKAKEQKTSLYVNKQLLDKPSTIFTDKVKLNKVLSNLLENALKFTNQGIVEIGYQLKKNGKNATIEIYVKDSGVGIDLEHQQLIFERFSQAEKELSKKVGGLGLGLSIAKENTELLGGEISVVSKKGEGATFFVVIPYKPVYKEIKDKNSKTKQTILIAEDEEINYLFLEESLSEEYQIIHAKNGLEAVEMFKNTLKVDLVLMDLKMPVMNGYNATKELRKLNSNIPIVAQTAYSTKADKEKAISAGCNDFISKPIDKETLFKTIENYLKT